MLQAKRSQESVYSPRKSRQNFYLKYEDDGKSKDVGPDMIMIRDEEDDKVDSSFPAAYSPTMNKMNYSLDIDLDIDMPMDDKQKFGMNDLYTPVVPKSERAAKNASAKKNDSETSEETAVSNGGVDISVDPHSQYARVIPKAQRSKKPAKETGPSAYEKPTSNGVVKQSDEVKAMDEARSRVLSAIGSEPVAVRGDCSEKGYYHKNISTAQKIESALGNKPTYRESAEL